MTIDPQNVFWVDANEVVQWESLQLLFIEDCEEIAKIYFKNGELCFEGRMCKAARMFFGQHIKPLADDYIQQRMSNGDI